MIRPAFWASQLQIVDGEFFCTNAALLAARAPLHFKLETFHWGAARQGLKGKIEGILIHVRQFSDSHANGYNLRVRPALRLGGHTFENRGGNSNFVHTAPLTNPRQLIASEHVHDARGAERRAHHNHARVLGRHAANDGGIFPEGMALQSAHGILRGGRRNNGN